MQSAESSKDFFAAKNLLQESEKESLLVAANYPEDLLIRWEKLQRLGLANKLKKEKEIFDLLFVQHGSAFYENCGKVVAFLESHGNGKEGKEGKEGKVYCPMSWIQGHWELNLTRYRNWLSAQEDLNAAHAKRLEQDAKSKVAEVQKVSNFVEDQAREMAWQAKMNSAEERFLSVCSTEALIKTFVEEAIVATGCVFTRSCWERKGWRHPLVRSCVLEHFLKIELGEKTSSVFVSPNKAL